MKELLFNRNFNLLFLSNMVFSFGTGISMIGIPWVIVKHQDGDWFLGMVTMAPTLLLFLISPYWGVLTDRYYRRTILILIDSVGFTLLLGISSFSYAFKRFDMNMWLFLFYLCSILLFYLRVPVVIGRIIELVQPQMYSTANSLIEIIYQISHVSAGAISILLLDNMSISAILLVNSLAYGLSWMFSTFTTFEDRPADFQANQKRKKIFDDLQEGWQYLKQRPGLLFFFLCAQLPNVVVTIGAYLFPLYVARVLMADGSAYAKGEIFYSIGAIMAGMLIRKIMLISSSQHTITLTVGMVSLAILLLTSFHYVSLFLFLFLLIGFGNAGSRIAQVTLMMEIIPSHLIGRVHSFFFFLITFLRILLLSVFTFYISAIGVNTSLFIEGGLLIIALIGTFYCKDLLRNSSVKETISS